MSAEKPSVPKAMSWGRAFGLIFAWMIASFLLLLFLAMVVGQVSGRGSHLAVPTMQTGMMGWPIAVPVLASLYHKTWKLAVAFAVSLAAIAMLAVTLLIVLLLLSPPVHH